jgi:hypothetical protein
MLWANNYNKRKKRKMMLNSCERQSIQDCSSRHEIDSGTCKKKKATNTSLPFPERTIHSCRLCVPSFSLTHTHGSKPCQRGTGAPASSKPIRLSLEREKGNSAKPHWLLS